jgi:hypothetical protein
LQPLHLQELQLLVLVAHPWSRAKGAQFNRIVQVSLTLHYVFERLRGAPIFQAVRRKEGLRASRTSNGMHHMPMHYGSLGMTLVGGIVCLLFLAVLVLGIAALLKYLLSDRPTGD